LQYMGHSTSTSIAISIFRAKSVHELGHSVVIPGFLNYKQDSYLDLLLSHNPSIGILRLKHNKIK
jgi:hypothetical protein